MSGLQTIYGKMDGGVFGRFNDQGEAFLYMHRELKEYRLVLTDRDGKRVSIPRSLNLIQGKTEQWNKEKWYVFSDALFFIHNKRNGVQMRLVQEFGTGFFVGMLFQRLITNKGVKLEVTEREMTASEMDDAIREIRS